MEVSSTDEIMDILGQAIHPQNMRYVVPRVLPKQLCLPPCSLKKELPTVLVETETTARKLSELPNDILMDIIAMLEIPDVLRAASVCSSWHSAYKRLLNLGQYKQSQTPCFLYTSQSLGDNIACLYTLAEKRTYKLTLPEPPISRSYLLGSSLGWLVTADERSEMHILNPITGEQFALPSVITTNQVTLISNRKGVLCKYRYSPHTAQGFTDSPMILPPDELRYFFNCKAFVFYERGYIVVLIHSPKDQLSFARLEHDKWTWLPPHSRFQDCTYKDGLLYAVTALGEIFGLISTPLKDYYGQDEGYFIGENLYCSGSVGRSAANLENGEDHREMGVGMMKLLAVELLADWGYRLDTGVLNLKDRSIEDVVSPRLWLKCTAPVLHVPNLTKMNSTFHK
uniref:F-box domain-containing protein n=1 Tax=Leersia perrieri TaxID=77586 RepID=A0A0D9VYG0_9ORYZ